MCHDKEPKVLWLLTANILRFSFHSDNCTSRIVQICNIQVFYRAIRLVRCKFARQSSYRGNLHDRARTVEICTIENLYGANLHDKARTVQICTIGLVRCKFASQKVLYATNLRKIFSFFSIQYCCDKDKLENSILYLIKTQKETFFCCHYKKESVKMLAVRNHRNQTVKITKHSAIRLKITNMRNFKTFCCTFKHQAACL